MTHFTEYEVGKFYNVPCVRVGTKTPACVRSNGWIPILLPWHEDANVIGFPYPHYHYDPRFLDKREYADFGFQKVVTRHPVLIGVEPKRENTALTFFDGPVVTRRLKCKRRMPPFPVFEQEWHTRNWPGKLETAYADNHLRNGICPHKGIDLTTCPVVNDVVTCPGHGLRWNVVTGKLVRNL